MTDRIDNTQNKQFDNEGTGTMFRTAALKVVPHIQAYNRLDDNRGLTLSEYLYSIEGLEPDDVELALASYTRMSNGEPEDRILKLITIS